MYLSTLSEALNAFLTIYLNFKVGLNNHTFKILGSVIIKNDYTYDFFLEIAMYLPYNRKLYFQ